MHRQPQRLVQLGSARRLRTILRHQPPRLLRPRPLGTHRAPQDLHPVSALRRRPRLPHPPRSRPLARHRAPGRSPLLENPLPAQRLGLPMHRPAAIPRRPQTLRLRTLQGPSHGLEPDPPLAQQAHRQGPPSPLRHRPRMGPQRRPGRRGLLAPRPQRHPRARRSHGPAPPPPARHRKQPGRPLPRQRRRQALRQALQRPRPSLLRGRGQPRLP